MPDKSATEQAALIWADYFALTKELKKFIDREDIDTFIELVKQRGALIDKLKALPANDYRSTDEFKHLAEQIKPLDMQIVYKARTWLNRSRRQNTAVRAYDLTGGAAAYGSAGNLVNRRY